MKQSNIEEFSEFIPAVVPKEFTPAEVEWAEENCEALSANQRPDFLSEFGSLAAIAALELSNDRLAQIHREFLMAAGWHQAFDRPALADKYKALAANARRALIRRLN
jgi:hypothetical protein